MRRFPYEFCWNKRIVLPATRSPLCLLIFAALSNKKLPPARPVRILTGCVPRPKVRSTCARAQARRPAELRLVVANSLPNRSKIIGFAYFHIESHRIARGQTLFDDERRRAHKRFASSSWLKQKLSQKGLKCADSSKGRREIKEERHSYHRFIKENSSESVHVLISLPHTQKFVSVLETFSTNKKFKNEFTFHVQLIL